MVSRRLALRTGLGALLLAGLGFGLLAGEAPGEKAKQAPGEGRQGRGQRGGFDPEQFRQMQMDQMKQALGATDEEWKALQPKVEKVMTASRNTRSFGGMGFGRGGPGGFGGPGGRGGPGGQAKDAASQTPVEKATSDLRTTLENQSASADEIKGKLAALRQAREKARADLVAAQKELRELLTQRQEATLVLMGTLE